MVYNHNVYCIQLAFTANKWNTIWLLSLIYYTFSHRNSQNFINVYTTWRWALYNAKDEMCEENEKERKNEESDREKFNINKFNKSFFNDFDPFEAQPINYSVHLNGATVLVWSIVIVLLFFRFCSVLLLVLCFLVFYPYFKWLRVAKVKVNCSLVTNLRLLYYKFKKKQ